MYHVKLLRFVDSKIQRSTGKIIVFFTTVNQMFDGFSQLMITAEHCFVVWTVLNDLITVRLAVVRSWERLPNILVTVAKIAFVI